MKKLCIFFRCIIVVSMYVSSTDVSSVMWCPLDSVTTCWFVHFTIGPSYFLHGLTVCPWVLIDFATFGPKLLLLSPRGKESFEKFCQFWWRFEPQTTLLVSKHSTNCAMLAWWIWGSILHPNNGTWSACPSYRHWEAWISVAHGTRHACAPANLT